VIESCRHRSFWPLRPRRLSANAVGLPMPELEGGGPLSDARALILRGQELFDSERHGEGFAVWDEVFDRHGSADDPELRACGARALQKMGYSLGQVGQNEEAVTVFEDLDGRFGGVDEPVQVTEVVALGLLGRAAALRRLGRHKERIPLYDAVVARYGDSQHPGTLLRVAWALFNKAARLNDLGKYAEAIGCADELLRRFGGGAVLTAEVEGVVARSLLSKAIALDKLGRHDEEIETYDLLVERYGSSEVSEMQTRVATALCWKMITFNQLGRYAATIVCAEDLVARFGSGTPVIAEVEGLVARGLLSKATALDKLGRHEEEIETYDLLVERYGSSEVVAQQTRVARALRWKMVRLNALSRYAETIACADDLETRFAGNAQVTAEAEEQVARGLLESATALSQLGRPDQANQTVERANTWFQRAAEAGNAGACVYRGAKCSNRGAWDEAEKWFRRGAETGNPVATFNLGIALQQLDDSEGSEAAFRQAAGMGYSKAFAHVGSCFQKRYEVEEAESWYRRGVQQGDTQAMLKLAYLLEGKGELLAGEQLVRAAAEAGDATAMMALGWRLEQRGEADEGRKWNKKGAAAGYQHASLGSYQRLLHAAWWIGRYGPVISVALAAVLASVIDLGGVVAILIVAPVIFTAVAIGVAVLAHRRSGLPTAGAEMRWFDSIHPAATYLVGILIPTGLIGLVGAVGAGIYLLTWGAVSLLMRFPFQQPLELSRLPEQAQSLLSRFPTLTATVVEKDIEMPVGGLVYRHGRITLNEAILDRNPDTVTFIVAHELAHAELQNVTRTKLEQLAGDAVCAVSACAVAAATNRLGWLGAASGTSVRTSLTTVALALAVAHVLIDPITAWRSRRFELEADRLAIGLLPPADRDRIVKRVVDLPLRLPRLYRLLARIHPTDAERLALLDDERHTPSGEAPVTVLHDPPDATLTSKASDAPGPATS
jgi:tetratricopeptide (TPR) repeat protein/Zn-dependent protease with chaperone function